MGPNKQSNIKKILFLDLWSNILFVFLEPKVCHQICSIQEWRIWADINNPHSSGMKAILPYPIAVVPKHYSGDHKGSPKPKLISISIFFQSLSCALVHEIFKLLKLLNILTWQRLKKVLANYCDKRWSTLQ